MSTLSYCYFSSSPIYTINK